MAIFNKFDSFVDGISQGIVNLKSDTFVIMLTNTAPVSTNTQYSDISANELSNTTSPGYGTAGSQHVVGTTVQNIQAVNWGTTYQINTTYQADAVVKPTSGGNGWLYKALFPSGTTSGASSGTAPTWGLVEGALNTTPLDGTVYWLNIGPSIETFVGQPFTWTATATWQQFRYAVLYDNTASTKYLVGWWDYGSSVSLNTNETFSWEPSGVTSGTGTILTLG